MISALFFLVMQTPQTFERTMPVGQVQWPTEISPAILPYLNCSQREFDRAQAKIEERNGSRGLDRAGMLEADAAARVKCSDERAIAREASLGLAVRIPDVSQEQRVQIVDAALSSIDARNAQLIALMQPQLPPLKADANPLAKETE